MAELRICVWGAAGRVGRRLCKHILEEPSLELSGCIEADDSLHLRQPVSQVLEVNASTPNFTSAKNGIPDSTDVIIDFSSPEGSLKCIELAREHVCPVVCGTTGLSKETFEQFRMTADFIPIFYAPNMSMGINLLLSILERIGPILLNSGFETEIVEIHHRYKKDAPSGTALKMAEVLCANVEESNRPSVQVGRQKGINSRQAQEIVIHALRGGQIFGEHQAHFFGPNETLEFSHKVHDRSVFVHGSIQAAKFLVLQPPGMYSFKDLF